jgi:hypothetical protein
MTKYLRKTKMNQPNHQKNSEKQRKHHQITKLQEENSKEVYCPKGAIVCAEHQS